MAEKLINESQKNPTKHSVTTIHGPASTATMASKNTISELGSVLSNRHVTESNSDSQAPTPNKKPPNGGVKCLPFLPPATKKTVDTTTNPDGNIEYNTAVQHRFELTNNSKSKRPISSQLQETIPLSPNSTPSAALGQMSQSGSRQGVIGFLPIKQTMSNENLCQSEDETDIKKVSIYKSIRVIHFFIISNPLNKLFKSRKVLIIKHRIHRVVRKLQTVFTMN